MDIDKLFNKFCNVVENNNIGVQLGYYSISLMGLAAAIRKVRPFSRFKNPSDIPNSFMRERRQLDGIVERIEPKGPLLMVNHRPLAFSLSTRGHLPVKIASVDINEHGQIWLQSVVSGKAIKFIPVEKQRDYVECEVILPKLVTYKVKSEKKSKPENLNLGESLVAIDFAKITNTAQAIPKGGNSLYFLTLKHAELVALKKKLGYKYYIDCMKLLLILSAQKIQTVVLFISTKSKGFASVKKDKQS